MQLYFKNLIEELNNIFSKPKNTFDDVQIQFYAKSYQQVARDYCKIFEKRTLHPALCSKKDEKIEFLGLRKDLTFTDAIDDDEEDPTCVNIFLTKNKIKINVPKALEAGATGDLTGFTLRPKQISVTNERKSKKDINGLCQNGTGMSNEFMSNLALIHIPDIVDLNNHQSVLVNVIATKIGHLLGAGHDINDNQKGIMSKTHADQRSTDFSEFSKTQIIPIIKRLISTKHENENQFSEGDIEPKKEAGSSQKKRSKKELWSAFRSTFCRTLELRCKIREKFGTLYEKTSCGHE
uniref:Uncharacterized protein n=1 Tax=Ditylenchus dipsaci TaxID=166011 RepID=A0A915EEF8_9BILA